MRRTLNLKSRQFWEAYGRGFAEWSAAAHDAEELVRGIVAELSSDVHIITGRAKQPESLRKKLVEKRYRDPGKELTDAIGVRVITCYEDDVDRIADHLKGQFDVDKKNTEDKRVALDLFAFGYRSVHLIVRLKRARAASPEHSRLAGKWFEIQIRSILEHAWAEIQHEVIYKGGMEYPGQTLRRFAAMAAVLEVLDKDFLTLGQERSTVIERFRQRYAAGTGLAEAWDVGRLLGFLKSQYPTPPSATPTTRDEFPLPVAIERSCVEALQAVGLSTARSFLKMAKSRRYRDAVRSFASQKQLAPSEVSHLARIVLAVAVTDARALRQFFPEMLADPILEAMVATRAARKPRG